MKLAIAKFIAQKLTASIPTTLLYVLQSEGSSPGRQGFHMAVSQDGELLGSIGGGIMEHKLVELAKAQLSKGLKNVEFKYQHHDKNHATNQSGLICSGTQVIAFFPVYKEDASLFKNIIDIFQSKKNSYLAFSPQGISIVSKDDFSEPLGFLERTKTDWIFREKINTQKVIHIFGGGHVSLALAEVMHFLGFYIKIYDDRSDINTLAENVFCDEKKVIPYDTVGSFLDDSEDDYVVIMTFGYRSDKEIVKQLLKRKFFYIGLMGSQSKIATLLKELNSEGYSPVSYEHVFTPIGIEIFSKSPKEIAISIAAEIIRETNRVSSPHKLTN